jgi:hypothetical protein
MRLLALLILLALPLLAQPTSTSAPRVEVFSPQGTVKGVARWQCASRSRWSLSATRVCLSHFRSSALRRGGPAGRMPATGCMTLNKASPRSGIGDRPRFLRDELGAGKAEGLICPQGEQLRLGRDPRERRETYRALCKAPLNQA